MMIIGREVVEALEIAEIEALTNQEIEAEIHVIIEARREIDVPLPVA
jgi:hypothetical protein